MKSFEELGVSETILRAIKELGFENPMPVQEAVIPYLLEGQGDVVALAQTGTGKTAAYGLPVIQKTNVEEANAQVLILSPTRELCVQIAKDLADFSQHIPGLHIIPMYGGSSIENQIRNFKRGAHIIVATPGRLIDLMDRGVVKLNTIRTVILDEADEMLNMGFSEDLGTILSSVPEERQMLMFSATMSREISSISKKYLHNAKEITIGARNEGAENVNHVYYMVYAKDKYLALKRIVDYFPNIYGIVFCRTRLETQEVADKLMQDGYNADALHGELSQAQRDLVMQKFRKRQLQLLVATDVAARGLDVEDLTHVINYGLPDDTENYTHRSGRTGRAGKTGTSIAIINSKEKGKIRFIEKTIGKTFTKGVIPTGQQICEKQLFKVIDDIESIQTDEQQIEKFLPDIFRRLDWMDKEDIVKRIVTREFGRFMKYYSEAPELEEVTNMRSDDEKRAHKAQVGCTRFFINIGIIDNISATNIIELINKHIKDRIDLGRIDLKHTFSFFESPEENKEIILSSLNGVQCKGHEVHVEVAQTEGGSNNRNSGHGRSSSYSSKSRDDRGDRGERRDYGSRDRNDRNERRRSSSSNSGNDTERRSSSYDSRKGQDRRPSYSEKKSYSPKPAGNNFKDEFADFNLDETLRKSNRTEERSNDNSFFGSKSQSKYQSRAPQRAPKSTGHSGSDDFDDFGRSDDWHQFFRSSDTSRRDTSNPRGQKSEGKRNGSSRGTDSKRKKR
jgi:ATP-dependent RNA helicase DeaD